MICEGRILVAERDGSYCLKLQGDVRLNLCTTIDLQVEGILADSNLVSVLIDLRDAEGLDSTTLGLLAKMAVGCRMRLGQTPTIVSGSASIDRVLSSVGFDRVFDIVSADSESSTGLAELPAIQASEDAVRHRVIDAHRVLMGLNPANQAAFADLVDFLEQS